MLITDEEPFTHQGLEDLIPDDHRLKLVKNSAKGILIDDDRDRESWTDLGYKGDERRNRFAIEVRARNGRVVAAVAWTPHPKKAGVIRTLGTYVAKQYRRRGIAAQLWFAMIDSTGCRQIDSEPVTNEGMTLVLSLEKRVKHLGVTVTWDSRSVRTLEDLRP